MPIEMSNIERGLMTFLIIVLILATIVCLLGCGVVQRFAEPIDRGACKVHCERTLKAEFSRYSYSSDSCYCKLEDGNEILAYQTLL